MRTYSKQVCVSTSTTSDGLEDDDFDCRSTGSGFFPPELSMSHTLEPSPLNRSMSFKTPMLIRKQKSQNDSAENKEEIPLVEKQGQSLVNCGLE